MRRRPQKIPLENKDQEKKNHNWPARRLKKSQAECRHPTEKAFCREGNVTKIPQKATNGGDNPAENHLDRKGGPKGRALRRREHPFNSWGYFTSPSCVAGEKGEKREEIRRRGKVVYVFGAQKGRPTSAPSPTTQTHKTNKSTRRRGVLGLGLYSRRHDLAPVLGRPPVPKK